MCVMPLVSFLSCGMKSSDVSTKPWGQSFLGKRTTTAYILCFMVASNTYSAISNSEKPERIRKAKRGLEILSLSTVLGDPHWLLKNILLIILKTVL